MNIDEQVWNKVSDKVQDKVCAKVYDKVSNKVWIKVNKFRDIIDGKVCKVGFAVETTLMGE